MTSNEIERARRQELLVEAATVGLGRDEWSELQRQAGETPGVGELEAMERAAAAIELARQPRCEPMPRHLLTAVVADADRLFATRGAPPRSLPRDAQPAWFVYGGWAAAAASILFAVGLVLLDRGPDRSTGPLTQAIAPAAPAERDEADDPVVARAALVASRAVLRRTWASAGDPAGQGVQGDVVWDARTQTGYMRFVGLRRNDPSIEQYQLWIFDGRRDERYPVDGGVFDVDGERVELVVPIRARLPVGTPLAFAVTLERTGGVVVSDRGRLVVIARVG